MDFTTDSFSVNVSAEAELSYDEQRYAEKQYEQGYGIQQTFHFSSPLGHLYVFISRFNCFVVPTSRDQNPHPDLSGLQF